MCAVRRIGKQALSLAGTIAFMRTRYLVAAMAMALLMPLSVLMGTTAVASASPAPRFDTSHDNAYVAAVSNSVAGRENPLSRSEIVATGRAIAMAIFNSNNGGSGGDPMLQAMDELMNAGMPPWLAGVMVSAAYSVYFDD